MADPTCAPKARGQWAFDADVLLPTEPRESDRIADAAYWSRVYTELLRCTESLLAQTREAMVRMVDMVDRSDASTDESLMAVQARRYRRRLAYWRGRVAVLAGRGTDADDANLLSLAVRTRD